MNQGSLTPVKYIQSTGVMRILFSYPSSCTRPVKLSIQGLQENKAYLDELLKISSIKYLSVKAPFGNQPPRGI